MNIRKLCFLIVLIIGNFLILKAQNATLSPASLDEIEVIDTTIVTITLFNSVKFIREGTLPADSFSVQNGPPSINVFEVNTVNDSVAELRMASLDFDIDYTIHIIIDQNIQTSTMSLHSTSCDLTANVESAVLVPENSPLTEHNIGTGSNNYIKINLVGEEFVSSGGTLVLSDFTLNNFPDGVTKDVLSHGGKSSVRVNIDYNPALGEFDANRNVTVTINSDKLLYSTSSLTTGSIAIQGYNESVSLSDSSNLFEDNLKNGTIELTLVNEDEVVNLNQDDLALFNFPVGTSIGNASISNHVISIELDFDETDFDAPDLDGQVRILSSVLNWNKTDDLYSTIGEIIIPATVEVPGATIEPVVPPLEEYNLDGRTITVTLTNDSLTTPYSLGKDDITLIDEPPGLSVGAVSINNAMEFVITLAHTHNDFDANIELGVSIDHNQLNEATSDLVCNNTTTLTRYIETPVANVGSSSELREFYLDTISLYISFEEEKFTAPADISDFTLIKAPVGSGIEAVADQADSSITLLLSFNGTDFDSDINDVQVSISNGVLDQTESGFLYSQLFEIKANIEPVVNSVSINNQSMMIGDVVTATIYLSEFTGSNYSLASGDIGGYPLSLLQKVDNDEYTATFTVSEFGNDYPDSVDIPVNNLQLNELPVTGEVYNGFISLDTDLLDANRPNVASLYVVGQEAKKIGDKVVLLISAYEPGLLPEDSTEINTVLMTENNVVFEEIGNGAYSLIYTIEANDQNVAEGDLKAKVYLRDPAGNVSTFSPEIANNNMSIDASVPVIISTTNATPTDTVIIGGEVILTVKADGSGYELSNTSEVNGVRKNEGLIFSSFPDSTYTIRYHVKDIDPTVAAGDLEARIILEDQVGNGSIADTIILDNDVAVFTEKPTALLTLGDEICIYDTATIYMTLSGSSPWKIKYRNSVESFYVENILTENFSVKIIPVQTTNYFIDSVWDGTGNSNIGFGNAIVIVNPLPVVNIIGLDTIYAVTDTTVYPLNGDPFGGDFFGAGVNSVLSEFTPSKAGLTGGVPHWIYYEYTDANICFNIDSQAVEIVDADVTFIWPERTVACYLDQEYILEAFNTASTVGSFAIIDKTYPDGFMVDNENNTVTFYPSILPWISGQDYVEEFIIQYSYLDGTTPLFENVVLEVEYFDTAFIVTDLTLKDSCSNETTFSLDGSRSKGVFTSFGGGIDSLGGNVYDFIPSQADTGINWVVYTYESNNGCKQYDSAMIVINEAPNPDFEYMDLCVPTGGGIISFQNISDTNGLGGTLQWEWNYGDVQSGKNDTLLYSMDNVSHNYSRPGERVVTLTTTVIETQCHRAKSIEKYLGNTPNVTISWDTECFTDAATEFKGESVTEDGSSIFNWKITDIEGVEIFDTSGLDLENFSYKFDAIDKYKVELIATSDSACVNSHERTIFLRQYITTLTDSTPYIENFETELNDWFAFSEENSTQSWTLGEVVSGKFPYEAADDGNKAWFTDSVNQNTVEQSWVTSPCYDFRGMRRPMISLDRKISSDRDRDGAVLQYSYNDGSNWHNVGAVDDGSINWYNTFRISNGPGGQGEGWTGGFIFDGSEPWKNSRHELDNLIDRSRVQFRIAYSSAETSAVNKEGFAFDNIWIGERSRIVLMEHFTNASVNDIAEKNQRINELVKHNPLDVIDVQYHAEVEGSPDRMNEDNPSSASARSLFYGTRQVPYTLIDGGLDGEMAYDFTENNDLDTLDLTSRTLNDPSFDIDLKVIEQDSKLDLSIRIEALESLPVGEYIVYTVIIEKHINESSYLVSGADTAFQNVVRDMVPNAAGVSLIREWEPGDSENIPLSWDVSSIILNPEMVCVVVFIQGVEDKVVYQAASNDPELNGDPVSPVSIQDVLKSRDIDLFVYPNPATDHVYLAFAEALTEKVEIQLFTHTGSLVQNRLLMPGTGLHEMSLNGLSKGVYYIRAIQDGRIIGTKKLLIMQ